MRSHLVSQVLLRRFTTFGKIRVFSKYLNCSALKKPNEIAYIETQSESFVRLERKWNTIESRIATVLEKLDNGTVLESYKNIQSIKKFISLLFVRSTSILYLMEKDERKYFDQYIKESILLYPEKKTQIENNIKSLRLDWIKRLQLNILPNSLQNLLKRTDEYIQSFNIEIGYAVQGARFLLGDTPVMNMNSEGKLGVKKGVGLKDSVGIALPLGPRHFAALTSKTQGIKYRELTNNEVKNLNMKIKQISFQEYYEKPTSI